MSKQTQLSFTPSENLLNTLTALDDTFKATYTQLQTMPERMRLAIHRYAKKGMLGWSASFADVMPAVALDVAAQPVQLQQQMRDLINADKRHSEHHEPQMIAGYLRILDRIYQHGQTFLPLTEAIILDLHSDLMRDIPNVIKGQYKQTPNSVKVIQKKDTEAQEIEFRKTATPGAETQQAIRDLLVWYNNVRTTVPWTIAVACEFLLRFFRIHPFLDGNGRLGRSLFLLILQQSPHPFIAQVAPYLGIYRHLDCYKQEFANMMGEVAPGFHTDPGQYKIEQFCNFMIPILQETLAAIPKYQQKLEAALREQFQTLGLR